VPLKEAHSQLSKLFRLVEEQYGDVRDGIVAHLDADADRRVALLGQVSAEGVALLTLEFLPVLESLSRCFLAYSRNLHTAIRVRDV
jgi:hypothetical protein